MTPSELENRLSIEQDEKSAKVISSTCEMESFSSRSGICGRPATHIWNNKEGRMAICDRCLLCVSVCGGYLQPIPKENNQKIKVGILGGSFDPITIGHVELAKFVLSNGIVDDIWLMPSDILPRLKS